MPGEGASLVLGSGALGLAADGRQFLNGPNAGLCPCCEPPPHGACPSCFVDSTDTTPRAFLVTVSGYTEYREVSEDCGSGTGCPGVGCWAWAECRGVNGTHVLVASQVAGDCDGGCEWRSQNDFLMVQEYGCNEPPGTHNEAWLPLCLYLWKGASRIKANLGGPWLRAIGWPTQVEPYFDCSSFVATGTNEFVANTTHCCGIGTPDPIAAGCDGNISIEAWP